MIYKQIRNILILFPIIFIPIANLIFFCNRNINLKKHSYAVSKHVNDINYDDSISGRYEITDILHKINYLKNAIDENNYILKYYKKIFSINVNYYQKQVNRINNKINASNISIIHELDNMYNMKNIIINHPYSYLFFFGRNNYHVPEIYENKNKKITSKLANIETFTHSTTKKTININNISYQSEESFAGIKSMVTMLNCMKVLVFTKIKVNYDNIYYFSKHYNNLMPITNYSSAIYSSQYRTNQFIDNTNINIKTRTASKWTSLFNKNSIGNYIANKPYVAILPFLFGIGVIIIILGGTKNGNRIIRKKIEKKLRVLIRKGTSLKETDEYISQMKSTISKQPNIDSIEMKELKSAELTPDSMEVTEGNLLDTECISGLMEKMPRILLEPRFTDQLDIISENSLDDTSFISSRDGIGTYEPWQAHYFVSPRDFNDISISPFAHAKPKSIHKTKPNYSFQRKQLLNDKTHKSIMTAEPSTILSQIPILPAPSSVKSEQEIYKFGEPIYLFEKQSLLHEDFIRALEFKKRQNQMENSSEIKWAILDDSLILKISQSDFFFRSLYKGDDYKGIKRTLFIQQILNHLFHRKLSLLEPETSTNKMRLFAKINMILRAELDRTRERTINPEVKDIVTHIFSNKDIFHEYRSRNLTTNGWFKRPSVKNLQRMRPTTVTRQELLYMRDQIKQFEDIQTLLPILHESTEYYAILMNEFLQPNTQLVPSNNNSKADRFAINEILCDLNEIIKEYKLHICIPNIGHQQPRDCPTDIIKLANFVKEFKYTVKAKWHHQDLKRFGLEEKNILEQVEKLAKK